jgi:hypothetical protein
VDRVLWCEMPINIPALPHRFGIERQKRTISQR